MRADMYEAIQVNNIPRVTELLSFGWDVDDPNHEYQTPLHLAVIKNNADSHFDMIEVLLKKNLSVNKRDYYDKTALHYEAAKSNLRTVRLLLDYKADVSLAEWKNYETPLFEAIRWGRTEVVKLLVDYGSDVNHQARYGVSPLHLACCESGRGNPSIVEVLLRKKAMVNAQDRYGRTPLHYAVSQNKVETVKLLLDHHADVKVLDVSFADKEKGETALFKAIRKGNTEVVKLLVAFGWDVNHQTKNGERPIHVACCQNASGNPAIVEVLLISGAKVNALECNNRTPLHYAVKQNKVETVQLLLDHHVDVKVLDNNGQTALFDAARYANAEIVQLLLDLGLDPNGLYDDGSTLLHKACERSQNFEIVQVLLSKGSRVNAPDNNGKTPLYYSTSCQEVRTFKLLLDHGANFSAKDDEEGLLLKAVRCGNFDLVQMLVKELGFNVKSIPLIEACSGRSNYRIFDLLLQSGAKVNFEGYSEDSALNSKVREGNIRAVRLLLDRKADVNFVDQWDETALIRAVRNNNFEMVKLLVDHGSDVNYVDKSCKRGPLHYASRKSVNDDHYEVIRALLEHKADLDMMDNYKMTPVDYLVTRTNVRTIELALKLGNSARLTSESVLFKVLRHRRFQIAQILLDYGSDLGKIDVWDILWSFTKRKGKHLELIKFFFRNGKQDDRSLMYTFANMFGSNGVMGLLLKYTDVNVTEDDDKDNILNYKHGQQRPKFWKMILRHIAKLQALKIYVHPCLIDTITKNNDYKNYLKLCEYELTVAKNRKLDNSWIIFFDLLVGNKRQLKNYAGNRDLIDAFEKSDYKSAFPSYRTQMRDNVRKGVRRRKLYDEVSILMSELLPTLNPTHLIVRDTLDCISTKDLSKLCES